MKQHWLALTFLAISPFSIVDTVHGQTIQLATSDRLTLGTEINRTASVRIGDLDGDGDGDVVVANGRHWPQQNYLFLNAGRAKFSLARSVGTDRRTSYAAEIADLDSDGDLDIVTANDMALGRIFLNDGAGRFAVHAEFGEVSSVRSLTTADIDRDTDMDLLITCRGKPNRIYLNDGKARFLAGPVFGTADDSTINVAVADIDNDGHLDLVLANRDRQPNEILFGDGNLEFGRRLQFGDGKDSTRAVVVADMNGDGKLDWVIANIQQANRLFIGDGTGGVTESIPLGESQKTYSMAVADMDNDGDMDVIAGNVADQNCVYLNDGRAGSFREVAFGDANGSTYGLAVGDLDGDGLADIAVANSDGYNRVFLNRTPTRKANQP